MPKAMEEALKRQARKKGYKGKRAAKYVYGTMNKMGYMHGNKRTSKGENRLSDALEKQRKRKAK